MNAINDTQKLKYMRETAKNTERIASALESMQKALGTAEEILTVVEEMKNKY